MATSTSEQDLYTEFMDFDYDYFPNGTSHHSLAADSALSNDDLSMYYIVSSLNQGLITFAILKQRG
jgi:hypothetical protein